MIEQFTKEVFESALPCVAGRPLWKDGGLCSKTGQHLYIVSLPGVLTYAMLVWSSVRASGASDKAPGKDSIRAIILKGGLPYGGKFKRWIPRTSGWRMNLLAMLRSLANQVLWLSGLPCPHCQSPLVPFTVKGGVHKGRPFVACTCESCPNRKEGKGFGFFAFTEDAEGNRLKPSDSSGVKPAEKVAGPSCPTHGPMVRMSSGKGWRCGAQGNRWENGKWSVCNETSWDHERCQPKQADMSQGVAVVNGVKMLGQLVAAMNEESEEWNEVKSNIAHMVKAEDLVGILRLLSSASIFVDK